MTPAAEVSFELERFEWTADDRLEVVGRWNGIRGRRIARPALTVDSGGRRRRVSGSQVSDGEPDEPWRASFDWDGGDIAGAELEIGRSLVVELPPPRRRRRRSAAGAEGELRAQVDELRGMVAELRAERAAAPTPAEVESLREDATEAHELVSSVEAERDRLAAELEATQTGDAELERLHAELAAAHTETERLNGELEALKASRHGGRRERAGARRPTAGPRQPARGARAARGRARGAAERPRRA